MLWGHEFWGGKGPWDMKAKSSIGLMKFPQQVPNSRFTLVSFFFLT